MESRQCNAKQSNAIRGHRHGLSFFSLFRFSLLAGPFPQTHTHTHKQKQSLSLLLCFLMAIRAIRPFIVRDDR